MFAERLVALGNRFPIPKAWIGLHVMQRVEIAQRSVGQGKRFPTPADALVTIALAIVSIDGSFFCVGNGFPQPRSSLCSVDERDETIDKAIVPKLAKRTAPIMT